MAQVVGKLSVLSTDAKGNYKLKMDDNKWYGTGSPETPSVTQGQVVQFDFELSKPWTNPQGQVITFNNITKGTLRPVTDGAPKSSSAPTSRAGGGSMSKDDFWANKEARDIAKEEKYAVTQQQIQLQSARNAAIEFVKILAGEKAIVYSAAQTKQTPAARLDTLETLVNHYTVQFVNETQAIGTPVAAEQPEGDSTDMSAQRDLG